MSVADTPPLMFANVLGSLHPRNSQAQAAIATLGTTPVEVRILPGKGNTKRMGFYWAMLDVGADNLGAAVEGGLTSRVLHKIIKRKLDLGRKIKLPSGEIHFDEDSVSFAEMNEPDRAEYVNRCATLLSGWLGVEVETLMDAARARTV